MLTAPLAAKLKVGECYSEQGVPRRWDSFPSPAIRIDGADINIGDFACRADLIHKIKIAMPKRDKDSNDISLEVTMRLHFDCKVPLSDLVDTLNKDTFELRINARQEDMGFEEQESEGDPVAAEAAAETEAGEEDQDPISDHLTGEALEKHQQMEKGPTLVPAALAGGTHQRGTKQQRGRRGGEVRNPDAEAVADGTAPFVQ